MPAKARVPHSIVLAAGSTPARRRTAPRHFVRFWKSNTCPRFRSTEVHGIVETKEIGLNVQIDFGAIPSLFPRKVSPTAPGSRRPCVCPTSSRLSLAKARSRSFPSADSLTPRITARLIAMANRQVRPKQTVRSHRLDPKAPLWSHCQGVTRYSSGNNRSAANPQFPTIGEAGATNVKRYPHTTRPRSRRRDRW